MTWRLIIDGPPRTAKNRQRIVRRKDGTPFIIAGKTAKSWERAAEAQLRHQWAGRAPIASPVNVSAVFYRDARRGDAVGYYQALADALEAAGVVENDRWILSWDHTRLAKDAARPRVEIVICAMESDHE